ncbi:MAG: PEP-CTERM sorting domain-containing protein [Deltaproteobacteria bacterium]|nr:PEP-CTERM sorting domain-containing protein [Deltaproteobacteria bacterium]
MKKKLTLLSASLFLLVSAPLIQAAPASAAPSVYFDFNGDTLADTTLNITPGSLFTADIYASDFVDMLGGAHGGLLGYGLNVSFDSLLATANSAAIAPPWNIPTANNVAPGNVSLGALNFDFMNPGGLATTPPLKLASISFTNLGAGSFILDLADLNPLDTDFGAFDGFDFDGLTTFQDAQVTAAVPLPGTVWLLGAGLAGIAGLRKKRREARG